MAPAPESLPDALRPVYDYWEVRCRQGALPARADIDPVDLAPHLPTLCLIDVERSGDRWRYRYRLVGTGVVDRMGIDGTGRCFDEIFDPDPLAVIVARYDRCVESGRPVHSRETMPFQDREFLRYDRLLLPLAADGHHVDTLLAAFLFEH